MTIGTFSVKNGVLINILMVTLLILGFFSLRRLPQEQFAEDLKVSRSRISSYEENRAVPPIDFLVDLSEYFNIPIDILVKNDLSSATDPSFINWISAVTFDNP